MSKFGWRFARCSSPSSGPVARILEHLATNEQRHSQTGLKLEQINYLKLEYLKIKIIWTKIRAEYVCNCNSLSYKALCRLTR